MNTVFEQIQDVVAATDSQESDGRMTLDNVVDFVRETFTDSQEVVNEGTPLRFRRQALNARRMLEGRLRLVRDRMRPLKGEEAEIAKTLGGLDDLIVLAWDAGARTSDGSLAVEETKPRRTWSQALVERACWMLGVSPDRFAEVVCDAWRPGRTVRQYK